MDGSKKVGGLNPPDFTAYTLAILSDGEIIHSSNEQGLRPLFEALKVIKGKDGLTLHDKVQGLAAARMVTASNSIKTVQTNACSRSAFEHYTTEGVWVIASKIVDNILNQDRTDVCYMEKVALKTKDEDEFLKVVDEAFAN